MVKVTKIAVWKVGNTYVEDAKEATRLVKAEVIRELLDEDPYDHSMDDLSQWIAGHWDTIESRTKAAMAGT